MRTWALEGIEISNGEATVCELEDVTASISNQVGRGTVVRCYQVAREGLYDWLSTLPRDRQAHVLRAGLGTPEAGERVYCNALGQVTGRY